MKLYEYKGKLYTIQEETKVKIAGVWTNAIVYKALYINKDGRVWVRTKEEFEELFKHIEYNAGYLEKEVLGHKIIG